MKSALKAKLGSDPNWVDALPLVLLGMRAAVKNDLHCSVAEMVFGEPLRLPGEFFVSSDGDMAADPAFVADLRQKIRVLRPISPVWYGGESRRSYVSQELSSATHVFVLVGPRETPLQSPYQGPFKVLERREKYFKLDPGNRHDMVSLDRIKPAFTDATDAIEPVPLVTVDKCMPHCHDQLYYNNKTTTRPSLVPSRETSHTGPTILTVVEFFKSLCSLFHITGPLILRHIELSVVLQYIFLKCPA